eukprot:14198099-Alexandrium_andersonii.AAC.1
MRCRRKRRPGTSPPGSPSSCTRQDCRAPGRCWYSSLRSSGTRRGGRSGRPTGARSWRTEARRLGAGCAAGCGQAPHRGRARPRGTGTW